jgi:hypothetical protein
MPRPVPQTAAACRPAPGRGIEVVQWWYPAADEHRSRLLRREVGPAPERRNSSLPGGRGSRSGSGLRSRLAKGSPCTRPLEQALFWERRSSQLDHSSQTVMSGYAELLMSMGDNKSGGETHGDHKKREAEKPHQQELCFSPKIALHGSSLQFFTSCQRTPSTPAYMWRPSSRPIGPKSLSLVASSTSDLRVVHGSARLSRDGAATQAVLRGQTR